MSAGLVGEPTSRVTGSASALWQALTGGPARELFARAELTASSMAELRWLIACTGEDPAAALAEELEARGTGVNREAVGTLYHGEPVLVSLVEIKQFAEATNDPNPWFVDEARDGGVVAPPLFPIRYFNLLYGRVVTDPSLQVDVSQLLFGEMALELIAPIRPKDLVVAKARILRLDDKETGQVMRVSCRLMCEGEVKVDSMASFFIRWEQSERFKRLASDKGTQEGPGEKPRDKAFEEPMQIREDQTKLFAKAANDPNPVHLDEKFAKSVGLPGIIVHGLCSMAFCSRAFVKRACEGDPARLSAIQVRFSKPARPGQTLSTVAYAPEEQKESKVYPFVAVNDEGEQIITAGRATVRK